MACIDFDETRLDCSHRLEGTAFEFHNVAPVTGRAFSKDTNGIEVFVLVFDLSLAFHYCFNNLVPFLFCATAVDIDAVLGFAKQPNEKHLS